MIKANIRNKKMWHLKVNEVSTKEKSVLNVTKKSINEMLVILMYCCHVVKNIF